jgi:predicted nucleotidyltransferase
MITLLEARKQAKQLQEKLEGMNIPVQKIYIYGSVASAKNTEDSDIDIAILCSPFKKNKHEENVVVRMARMSINPKIEPVCIHPEDLHDNYSTLISEIKQHGIEIV